jgi:antitoxin ParD1/3/4
VPTRNVNLTEELDRFVAAKVKTGRYENASEVIRSALPSLERTADQIADMATRGEDISSFFTNEFTVVRAGKPRARKKAG